MQGESQVNDPWERWRGPAGVRATDHGGALAGGMSGWEVDTLFPLFSVTCIPLSLTLTD